MFKWVRTQCFIEQGGQAASLAVAENYVKVGRQYWAFDQSVWFASECLKIECVLTAHFTRLLESLQRRATPFCCLPMLEMLPAWSPRWLLMYSHCHPSQPHFSLIYRIYSSQHRRWVFTRSLNTQYLNRVWNLARQKRNQQQLEPEPPKSSWCSPSLYL